MDIFRKNTAGQASGIRPLTFILFGALTASAALGQQQQLGTSPDIPTWQGDTMHTGLNSVETILTPGNVAATGNFGVLFTQQLDGQTFGQPLYVSSATLSTLSGSFPDGQQHNAIYVTTQHGSIYCFDADKDLQGANPNGTNSDPLWHVFLPPPGTEALPQTDVSVGRYPA